MKTSQTTFIVPKGMSCVNAFRALWENSQTAAFFKHFPDLEGPQAESVATAEKIADLFKTHMYFDYEGGRLLKMDFAHFPELNARLYDRNFGPGAAQRAIEKYDHIHPSKRFDKNDSYEFEKLTAIHVEAKDDELKSAPTFFQILSRSVPPELSSHP